MSGSNSVAARAGVAVSALPASEASNNGDTVLVLQQQSGAAVLMQQPAAVLLKTAVPVTAIGEANGVAALDETGALKLSGVTVLGRSTDGHLLLCVDLSPTDPLIAGALWNNGGAVFISQG